LGRHEQGCEQKIVGHADAKGHAYPVRQRTAGQGVHRQGQAQGRHEMGHAHGVDDEGGIDDDPDRSPEKKSYQDAKTGTIVACCGDMQGDTFTKGAQNAELDEAHEEIMVA